MHVRYQNKHLLFFNVFFLFFQAVILKTQAQMSAGIAVLLSVHVCCGLLFSRSPALISSPLPSRSSQRLVTVIEMNQSNGSSTAKFTPEHLAIALIYPHFVVPVG